MIVEYIIQYNLVSKAHAPKSCRCIPSAKLYGAVGTGVLGFRGGLGCRVYGSGFTVGFGFGLLLNIVWDSIQVAWKLEHGASFEEW